MPKLSFKSRFIPLIKSGAKKNTIRKNKTDQWAVGSDIHFWEEDAVKFGVGVVSEMLPVSVYPSQNKVLVAGLPVVDLESFAQADGSANWADMVKFFPIDFHGSIIFWELCEPINSEQI